MLQQKEENELVSEAEGKTVGDLETRIDLTRHNACKSYNRCTSGSKALACICIKDEERGVKRSKDGVILHSRPTFLYQKLYDILVAVQRSQMQRVFLFHGPRANIRSMLQEQLAQLETPTRTSQVERRHSAIIWAINRR